MGSPSRSSKRELVGGECSYWGCVPSKTLIRPGDVLAAARRVPGTAQAADAPRLRLLFLSGLEIDPLRLRGRLLRVALLGYVVTLALGVPIGLGADALGWVSSPVLLVIALSATSLGLVVPVLKDAGRAEGEVGQTTIVAATVADFSAIVLLSMLFSAAGGSPGSRVVLIAVFTMLVAATGVVVGRIGMSRRLGDILLRLQDTTAEVRVRFAVVLLIALTALAEQFGLENILGAFLAGVVVSVVDRDSTTHPFFRAKLEAVGFGFVIPVFFVSSGVRLDLQGLLDSPSALLRVPVMRGVPALLYVRTLGRRPCEPRASLRDHEGSGGLEPRGSFMITGIVG